MKEKEVIQTAITLIIAVFLIYSLIPFATGSEKPMIVLSGSMTPLFLPGDMILEKSINPNELRVGDVMTFQLSSGKPGTLVTHRIIFIEEGKERIFHTKGDANNAEDMFTVPASKVEGKLVFVIPFAGYLPDYFKRHVSYFLLMIMFSAGLLIRDEIKNLIIYSSPSRARKVEREIKKAERRISYKIKGLQLAAIVLFCGLIFTGIVAFNIGENGSSVIEREKQIDNSGFLPMVYAMTPNNLEQKLAIHSWYGVISPDKKTHITVPDNTPVQISSVPYILPVFWILALADINPYLPVFAEIVLYTSVFTLFLFPVWYKKSRIGRHKKRIRFHRLVAQWKRTLHFG
jgi:signal peptidase